MVVSVGKYIRVRLSVLFQVWIRVRYEVDIGIGEYGFERVMCGVGLGIGIVWIKGWIIWDRIGILCYGVIWQKKYVFG